METEQYYFLKSKHDGNVADVAEESRDAGAALIASPQKERTTSGAPDNQLWELVVSDTPPYFFIASRQTGQVIDVKEGKTTSETRLVAYPEKDSNTDNQRWMLVPSDATEQYFFITSKLGKDALVATNIEDPVPPSDPNMKRRRLLVLRPRATLAQDDQLWSLVRFR